MEFFKKATATLFVMAIMGIAIAVTPSDAGVLTSSFIYSSLLFTALFAIQQLAEKGSTRDKALRVLLSPLVGMSAALIIGVVFLFWQVFVGLAILAILGIVVLGIWRYIHRV